MFRDLETHCSPTNHPRRDKHFNHAIEKVLQDNSIEKKIINVGESHDEDEDESAHIREDNK